jgi:hypothetical protein
MSVRLNPAVLKRLFRRTQAQTQAARAMRPNPSIERTPYGTLRVPSVAAHVER